MFLYQSQRHNYILYLKNKVEFNQGDANGQNFLITALATPVPA
jgi:hypothetical protein